MKQVTLQIPDKKYPFFMELVKNLGFAKKIITEEEYAQPTKDQILAGIKQSVIEVNLINEGKLQARDAWELIDEL